MKTYVTKKGEIHRKWYLIDAEGVVLGKIAVCAADLLRGKGKVNFTPNVDCGDFVVIVNASKIKITGGKEEKKKYFRHSWYPGGLKTLTLDEMMAKDPRKVIEHAVSGMLPKNKLAREIFKKLKVYAGDKHEHEAQKPEAVKIPN